MNIKELGEALATQPQVDLGVKHYFVEGIYAKEMHLPQGHIAVSHSHTYSHIAILAEGSAIIQTDSGAEIYHAPACIEILAGYQHSIEAIEDVTWFCIHRTDVTEVELVDKVLIKEK